MDAVRELRNRDPALVLTTENWDHEAYQSGYSSTASIPIVMYSNNKRQERHFPSTKSYTIIDLDMWICITSPFRERLRMDLFVSSTSQRWK